MTHDLIIVGGGPAGSSCARRAAQLGLDVLVLEKAHHPRRKPCAGGITPRVRDLLDFDITSVVEREQCGINLYSPSMVLTRIARTEATGYTVRREDFDHFLLKKAEEAGATVQQGVRVTDVIEESDGVRVVASNETYSAKLVVGAEGPNSVVARKTGLKPRWEDDEISLCIESTVPMDASDILRIAGEGEGSERILIEIYFGIVRHGYGWMFAKGNEVSLGMGALVSELEDFKGSWKKFVASFEERNGVKCDLSEQTAARVPLCGMIKNTCSKNVMLVGDAAGFVSPTSGEGISFAIESGQIAAEVAKGIVAGEGVDTMTYHKRVWEAIGKGFKVAKFMANMLFHSKENMERACQMAHDDEVMRELTLDLIIGLRPYKEIRNGMIKRMLRKHPMKALRMVI
jgi:geranylgeranyl reductase family protein